MASNKQIAENAVQNALKELRHGNKQAARAWAHRAIASAPDLEDPWLVLAAVSEPRASLEYLKKALKINPASPHARQGLFEVQQRLEKISRVANPPATRRGGTPSQQRRETTAQKDSLPAAHREAVGTQPQLEESNQADFPQSSHPAMGKKTGPSWLSWFILISICGLVVITIMAMTVFTSQSGMVQAHGLTASEQSVIVLQPMATSTATVTETPPPPTDTPVPTETPLPTSTETPEPSATSSPTLSPTPTQVDTPIAVNPPKSVAAVYNSGGKRIVVYLSQQHLYAYQGDTLVFSFVVSTGASNSTRLGTFPILDKISNAWSDPWGFWMPYWMGIYWVGYTENGIHALPVLNNGSVIWGNGLGTPISHGCVVLSTADAHLLFNWAEIGTQVQILR